MGRVCRASHPVVLPQDTKQMRKDTALFIAYESYIKN